MSIVARAFQYAGRGIWFCLRHERNFRIHLVAAAYVLAFAPSFSLSRAEWAVLILTLAVVLAAEALNTAVEQTINLVSPQRHVVAGTAKDVAAGGVLLSALGAVGVGIALFWRPDVLSSLWTQLLVSPWKIVLLGLSLIVSVVFVFCFGVSKQPLPALEDKKKNVVTKNGQNGKH